MILKNDTPYKLYLQVTLKAISWNVECIASTPKIEKSYDCQRIMKIFHLEIVF